MWSGESGQDQLHTNFAIRTAGISHQIEIRWPAQTGMPLTARWVVEDWQLAVGYS